MAAGIKPRVLLDIAFLGHGFSFNSHQRGMHRVVSHIFEGVRHSREVDLSFVATSNLAGARDFLRARGVDAGATLKPGGIPLFTSRVNRSIVQYIHRTLDDRRLHSRVMRRLLSKIAPVLAEQEKRSIPARLAEADIYHAPDAHVPPPVWNQPGLKCFVTINDVIPLTNPEYCDASGAAYGKVLIETLTKRPFVFCISEFVRSEILRLTPVRPENVFLTPLAADRDLFFPVTDPARIAEARKTCGIGTAPYFLALSSHDPHKNFEQIIRCFGELALAGELKEHNLVIAGPNPQRRSIVQEAIAKYPGIGERIIVTGYIAEADLAAVYSGATAFLFPSLAEGFGIPALEAMQCGTPVIGSNTSSIPEVVGAAGILLAPHDRDAWCAAMISLAGDTALRAELSRKSGERAALFSWQRFTDGIIAGYKKSLET